MSAEQTPDIETLAVDICSHSGRHTAGDGDHDAEQWGACSQCKHYARVVAPVLAAAVREARAAAWDEGREATKGWVDECFDADVDAMPNPYRADRIAVDAPEGTPENPIRVPVADFVQRAIDAPEGGEGR